MTCWGDFKPGILLHRIFTLPLLFFTFRCFLTFGTPVTLWRSSGVWNLMFWPGWGGASCQSGGACFKRPPLPPSPPPAAAARACAVAHQRARESGATYCPPARARAPLPAGAASTLLDREIVQATYCDFRRGDREVETATLSACIAGDCARDLL